MEHALAPRFTPLECESNATLGRSAPPNLKTSLLVLTGILHCMLLIDQIRGGSSECWHGNQSGDLFWVDRNMWASCLETFARWKRWDSWEAAALDNRFWNQSRDEFCQFIIGQRG